MGKRGPAKSPEAVKLLEGTYREDRHGGTLKLRPGIPKKPDWLDQIAGQVWDETINELSEVPGLLSEADGPALAMYCDAWRKYWDANSEIESRGLVIETLTAVKSNPAVLIATRERDAIARFGARFGLTPSDRASFKPAGTTDTNDELGELIA